MAKDPNYQFSAEKVYNLLVERFPAIFQRLARVPDPLPHPGDQPRRPIRSSQSKVDINPTDTFTTLVEKLKPLCPHRNNELGSFVFAFEEGAIRLFREVTGAVIVQSSRDHSNDDWTDDGDYERRTYGEVNQVVFTFEHLNPNYDKEWSAYEFALKQWEQKTKSRRERTEKINIIKKGNQDKINDAIKNHRDLWIAAGRELRDGTVPDLLQVKRSALLRELELVEQKLAEINPVEVVNE